MVASPQAYAFAYYRLPYAIDLVPVKNEAVGGYLELVKLSFGSVDYSPSKERALIIKSLGDLQKLMDNQVYTARVAGFIDYTNTSRSYISQFYSNGRAMIAIRELMSSQALFNKLVARAKSLSDS